MSNPTPTKFLRYTLLFLGFLGLVLTFGFFTQQPWATMLVPWELDRLSCIFLASIAVAVAMPTLWIGLSGEYAALTGGALNFCVLTAGLAAFSFVVYASNPRPPVLLFGIVCAIGLVLSLALVYFGLRQNFYDTRPLPRLVRVSFGIIAVILIITGASLVLKQPAVFPWQLTAQQSVLYGWIFLGAAVYFIYGVLRPVWANAKGQLLGFLAYDLVLILPFVALFVGNEPFGVTSLLLYIAILISSGALAIYYLILNRDTRISFRPAAAPA